MSTEEKLNFLIYSDDASVRQEVIKAVGIRPAYGMAKIEWKEVATATIAQDEVHSHHYDLLVLDGEATKISGTVLAKTLLLEEDEVPPILMLVARPQDQWLASWSGAAKAVERPLDPIKIQEAIVELLK